LATPSSARKRHKQSLKRRARNRHVRSTVRTAVRKVRAALAEGQVDQALEALPVAASVIARAAAKGVLHRKTAARKISRLARAAHRAAAAPPTS